MENIKFELMMGKTETAKNKEIGKLKNEKIKTLGCENTSLKTAVEHIEEQFNITSDGAKLVQEENVFLRFKLEEAQNKDNKFKELIASKQRDLVKKDEIIDKYKKKEVKQNQAITAQNQIIASQKISNNSLSDLVRNQSDIIANQRDDKDLDRIFSDSRYCHTARQSDSKNRVIKLKTNVKKVKNIRNVELTVNVKAGGIQRGEKRKRQPVSKFN